MKRIVVLMVFVTLVAAGCDLFNDQFTLAVNMDPVTHTYGLSPGGTSYTLAPTPFDLSQYVDDAYVEDITGGGIYDVGIQLKPAHNSRTIDGNATISYGGYTATISYSGNWNDFSSERTILRDPSLVTIDNSTAFNNLVNAIFSQKPLPVITLSGTGSSNQAITAGDSVTVFIYGQAATAITM
jgi:hypothetical protein